MRPLSRNLCQRVVSAVLKGGLSNNEAAARIGIAVGTAILAVHKFKATSSLGNGKIASQNAEPRSGHHRHLRLGCCQGGRDVTLRGLVAKLA